jgi:hypothetical protein
MLRLWHMYYWTPYLVLFVVHAFLEFLGLYISTIEDDVNLEFTSFHDCEFFSEIL